MIPAADDFSLRRIAYAAYMPSILFGIGEGAILPAVPLTARELGGSVAQAALMTTLIGLGGMACNIPASIVTMRWGERRALVAAAIWGALAMVMCLLTSSLLVLSLGCFMVGMSQSVYNLARQSWLTAAVPLAWRARALSTLGGVMRIGLFVGPLLAAGVIHAVGLPGAYMTGIVAMLVGAVVCRRIPDLEALPHRGSAAASTPPAPADPGAPALQPTSPAPAAPAGAPAGSAPVDAAAPPSTRQMLRDHRRVFVRIGLGVLLIAAVRAVRQTVVPLWADHVGLAASTTSLISGLAAAFDMLVFYPAGRVMDQRGRLSVVVPSMAIMGLALVAMPLAHGALGLAVAACVLGLGNGIGSGLLMTLGADYSPARGRPIFLGLWRLLSDAGSTSGPALLSLLAASTSLAVGIALTALLAFAAAAQLAWWLPRMPATRYRAGPA